MAASRLRIALALAAVYVIWGSTYVAIAIGLETLPPFLMAGARWLAAGAILYAVARLRGAARPTARQWGAAAIVGVLLIAAGNGGVSWAEQRVASGTAALLIATVPLWMALLDWLVAGGGRPGKQTLAGLAVGFGGVVLLVAGKGGGGGAAAVDPLGVVVLVGAACAWAAGSLYFRRPGTPRPASPLVGVAAQMICGGAVLLVLALLNGEQADRLLHASGRSIGAVLFLLSGGSIMGFTAYTWLLRAVRPAVVSTYAYVNPIVAVALGWLVFSEPVDARMLLAGGTIVVAVALIVTAARPPAPVTTRTEGAPPLGARAGARVEE